MSPFLVPQRMELRRVAPHAFRALLALDEAARQHLDPELLELAQIRAAQLNHCAYCIDYHTTDARKAGETETRLYQLSAWRESSLYSSRERAALALTEAMTNLADGMPDEVYDEAAAQFTESELAHLIALIATANAWNRINVTTRKSPGTA